MAITVEDIKHAIEDINEDESDRNKKLILLTYDELCDYYFHITLLSNVKL